MSWPLRSTNWASGCLEPRGSLPDSALHDRLTNSALHDRLAVRRWARCAQLPGVLPRPHIYRLSQARGNHAYLPLSAGPKPRN
jgi:hypothetical protein